MTLIPVTHQITHIFLSVCHEAPVLGCFNPNPAAQPVVASFGGNIQLFDSVAGRPPLGAFFEHPVKGLASRGLHREALRRSDGLQRELVPENAHLCPFWATLLIRDVCFAPAGVSAAE
ncbi:MAG: hypothetical protein IT159_09085 [Bryobacterales bacterium]|nr:hypothetical protein [Bryobacterales bacterium]